MLEQVKQEIPIFFSTDDTYIPCLSVAIKSIIANANENNIYKIIILNTGLKTENKKAIKDLEKENVKIQFSNITDKIKKINKELEYRLRDYYSVSIYYRLFIPGLFPEYKKAIYLDCDIVVIKDIADLFNIDLKDNFVGAIVDGVVSSSEIFKKYSDLALGLDNKKYFNSGVLLMNLEKFRNEKIKEKFLYLLCNYNFDTIAPDQDYLNVLCKDKVLYLNNGWDKMPIPDPNFDEKDLCLIHYNMFQKPWLYENVLYDEYFWKYAKETIFYDKIKKMQLEYTDEQKENDEKAAEVLLNHALEIIKEDITFASILTPEFMEELDEKIKNEVSTNNDQIVRV